MICLGIITRAHANSARHLTSWCWRSGLAQHYFKLTTSFGGQSRNLWRDRGGYSCEQVLYFLLRCHTNIAVLQQKRLVWFNDREAWSKLFEAFFSFCVCLLLCCFRGCCNTLQIDDLKCKLCDALDLCTGAFVDPQDLVNLSHIAIHLCARHLQEYSILEQLSVASSGLSKRSRWWAWAWS